MSPLEFVVACALALVAFALVRHVRRRIRLGRIERAMRDAMILPATRETPREAYEREQATLRAVEPCPECGFRHLGECRMVTGKGALS